MTLLSLPARSRRPRPAGHTPAQWRWRCGLRTAFRRGVTYLAATLCVVLVVALNQQVAAQASARFSPPKPRPVTPVAVQPVPVRKPVADPAIAAAHSLPPPVWPAAGVAQANLPAAAKSPVAGGAVRVGKSPVLVNRPTALPSATGAAVAAVPAKVRVEVLDRTTTTKAEVRGLLLRVGRADGIAGRSSVNLTVDYSGFATAYGADWATRLRLVALPSCALTTPALAQCQGTVLPSHNDVAHRQVSADMDVSGMVSAGSGLSGDRAAEAAAAQPGLVAVTAGTSGAAGSYAATSLTPSSTWSAGASSGNFSWSYPMRTPPALGGPAPDVALSYSSQSVDGRMAASNNQPSVVGEGFELATGGYVERRYKSCADDMTGGNNTTKTGDACWATDNAILNLDGRSQELIKDNGNGNLWHPRNDDGSRIEHKTGASNGDNNGEWWVVTTANGTQYWFGRNQLPGWVSGRLATNSVFTEPVFGNQSGEPCHQSAFAASACTQAWRWNLDYVVDPHSNTMSFWYTQETNYYAKNMTTSAPVSYMRGGHLDRIDYGTRVDPDASTGTDTTFSGHPTARVSFGYGDRCLSGCATHDGTHWTDTPWDLNCDASTCNNGSPTFWATSRLASVTTQVWDGSANYRNVEQWTLTHTYPDPGDGTRPGLWLAKVSHAGLVGTTTPLPDITFGGVQLNNRVDTLDGSPAMNWWRMTEINTETGGRISVAYSAPDCVARTRVPSVPQSNALRCYPVRWTPVGNTSAITDYFHKYVVTTVTESDMTGGAPRIVHNYTYLGDPAWHYTDDDGLIDPDNKTWSQWRGYARVGTSVGDPGEQTYSESLFMRGMNGDHLPSGTRSVTVADSQGGTVGDEDAYAGAAREQRVFNGPGGVEISGVINDPWQSAPTATRTIDGVTVAARYVNTQGTHNRTTLDGGREVRRTSTHTDFDAYGMPVRATDFGDDAISGDEQCAKTTYEPRNTSAWLLSYPQRAQTFALTCDQADAGPLSAADIIGDGRTSYDGQASGTAPTKGDVTAVDQMSNWSGGTTTYLTVSKSGYDTNGRVTDSWDVLNNHSTTAYTPATGGPVTKAVDTNPKSWTTTTTLEPAWGTALSTVDVNGRRTDLSYDGLGRLTAAWLPGRVKGTDTADFIYAYPIRTNGAVAVTSQSLNPNGGYITSYTLYDGLLRPRQTQTASPSGGRLLTDTFYDTAGRTVKTFAPYYATGAPGPDLVGPTDITTVPKQTRTTYDGAGRPIASIYQPYNVERWRTSTYYGGDHTDVTPPAGGTPSSTIVDARGRKVEARQYHASAASGAYDATTYTYNRQGLLSGVTDPAGDHWNYTYDLRGRQTRVDDPDKGATTSSYDDAGRLTSTTDSRGTQLTATYDTLSRKTALYQGTASGTKLAAWTYDATFMTDNVTVAKGQQSSATRFVGTAAYKVATDTYTDRYQPTGSTVTVPASETGLAGSYDFSTYYNPDGSLNTVNLPQTGDVGFESLGYHYTDLGLPTQLTTFYFPDPSSNATQSSYVSAAEYDALAQPTSYTLYTGKGGRVYQGFERELETGRLTHISTTRDSANPNTVFDAQYTYDNAGNVTQITDAPPLGTADTQCFGYDYLRRLSQAWTPSSGSCNTAPTSAGLGGPAKYWQSWTYDLVGDRQSQVEHATATGDVKTTYTYPGPAAAQPHTLTGTSTTDSTGTKTASYAYDTAGNTTSRPAPTSGSQTLNWDAEGHLASTTDASGTVRYLYDADGNRLIRTDATGKTLYLPGEELRYTTATAAKTCTRYYSFGSGTVAQRTAAGITWLAGDQQGTAQLAINADTQAVTQRRQTPFGGSRGTQVAWPNEKGFVGGTADPNGLTQLGARAYDSGLGRFISVDPVMDLSDPQQMSGYAYAADTPVTSSDPSGMMWTDNGGNFTATPGPISQAPNTGNDSGNGSGGGGNSGGGGQHKKGCGTFDFSCHASQAFHKAVNFVDDHKAIIAGIAVGVVVGVGCEATFGVVTAGAGSVACAAAAGAAGSMTDYAITTRVEHKGEFSWSGLLVNGAIGGAAGALTAGVGLVAGPALRAGAAALAARVGLKAAVQVGGRAAAAEARSIAAGVARGLGGGSARKGESQAVSRVLGCHSFAPDTRVVLAGGGSAAIKDVRVGQKVVATDPVSGRSVAEPVTALHLNRDTDLADVSVRTAGGVTVLHATQRHPFWDQTIKQWVDAGKLVAGHRLRVLALAVAVVVVGVHNFTGQQEMRDLTVAQVHTYYVIAGTTPVLVHNCGGSPKDVAADYRANPDNGVGGRRNVAVAQHDIDGVTGQHIGVSGQHTNPGSVGLPTNRVFNPGDRPFDSENKIFEHYASTLEPGAQGTINLYSEREPCLSCSSVIDQFQEMFPGIRVNVSWG